MFGGWYRGYSWIWSQYGRNCDQYSNPVTDEFNIPADADSNSYSGRGVVPYSCSPCCEHPYPTADTDH